MPPFACTTPGGADLCLNGGVCVTNASSALQAEPSCECPMGFGPDTSLFHFANCTLPSDFYLIFFIFSTAASLPLCFVIAQQIARSKARARLVAAGLFQTVFFAWLYHFGLYYEDGCFVLGHISLLISLTSEGATMSLLTLGLLDPVFGLNQKFKFLIPLKELLWGTKFFIAYACLFTPFLLALPILSRLGSRESYNNAVAVFLLIVVCIGEFYLLSIWWLAKRLVAELSELISAKTITSPSWTSKVYMENLIKRLSRLSRGALTAVFLIGFVIPLPVLYLTIGSFPYAWVLSPVGAYSGCLVFAMSVVKFVRTEQARADSGSGAVNAVGVTSSRHPTIAGAPAAIDFDRPN